MVEYLIAGGWCRRATFELFFGSMFGIVIRLEVQILCQAQFFCIFWDLVVEYLYRDTYYHRPINKHKLLHSRSCNTPAHHNATTTMFCCRLVMFQISLCMPFPWYKNSSFVHKYNESRSKQAKAPSPFLYLKKKVLFIVRT